MGTLEIILPDKKRLKLPTNYIKYSSFLRDTYESNKATSNNPNIQVFIPSTLPITEAIAKFIVKFIKEIDNTLSPYLINKISSVTNISNYDVIDPTYIKSVLKKPIKVSTKITINQTVKNTNVRNNQNNNNKRSQQQQQQQQQQQPTLKPVFIQQQQNEPFDNNVEILEGDNFIDLQIDDISNNSNYQSNISPSNYFNEPQLVNADMGTEVLEIQGAEYSNIPLEMVEESDSNIKHKIFQSINVKGLGPFIDSIVICAQFFGIIDNLLIRAIRYQLERKLMEFHGLGDARRYLDIPNDLDAETMDKIMKEDSFGKSNYSTTDSSQIIDLYQSFVDTTPFTNNRHGHGGGDGNHGHDNNHQKCYHPDIVQEVKARKLLKAVKDGNTQRCHNCDIEFNYINRRHHCRECGYIFCQNCTNQKIDSTAIPNPKYYNTKDYFQTSLRVCNSCHVDLLQQKNYGSVHTALTLLALKFPILRRFASMSTLWRQAAIAHLSDIREIQYSFPTYQFKSFEKEVLWRNKAYFQGHCKWVVKLLESINWANITPKQLEKIMYIITSKNREQMNCYYLMCTSACETTIAVKDVFPLLDEQIKCNDIRKFAVNILSDIDNEDIIYYLPQLVYFLRFEPFDHSYLKDFLFSKALESPYLAHFLLWELKNCQKSKLFDSKYEVLKGNLMYQLSVLDFKQGNQVNSSTQTYLYGMELLNILQNMPPTEGEEFQAKLKEIHALIHRKEKVAGGGEKQIQIRYPLDPNYIIHDFDTKNATIKNSTTKPCVITFHCHHCESGEEKKMELLFKKDDVRKDRIILNIISIMTKILKNNLTTILQHNDKQNDTFELAMTYLKDGDSFGFTQTMSKLHNILVMSKNEYIVEICKSNYDEEKIKIVMNKLRNAYSKKDELIVKIKKDFMANVDSFGVDIREVLNSIVTYGVLPCGNEYGFIEYVQDAQTLYEIQRNTIQDIDAKIPPIAQFFKVANNRPSHICIQNFKRSLAAWIVFTHLLGVGDRHDENIMINGDGYFFHIDYGFILGREPKPISNYLRYSNDFIATIASTESIESFKRLSCLLFGILRKEAPFFLYHLMFLNKLDPVMENSSKFSQTYIQDEVANRFFPGLPTKVAEKYFEALIDSQKDTMSQYISDTTHMISKMTPKVTQSMTSLVSSSISGIGSIISKIPNYWSTPNQPIPPIDDDDD